ncbi:MAG TPA: KTSC domain-containing protein [Chitinophagaceae bacterium]|nr:KTSC domain-containing protein [Chitinophagaceae bacterium]
MPSTVISSMNYNADTSTLRVTFISGMIYEYKDVPEEVYIAMKTSGAKGIYLNQHIKSKYRFEKIR